MRLVSCQGTKGRDIRRIPEHVDKLLILFTIKLNTMKKFISQTAADDNGNYTITYIDHNDVLITKHMNLYA